MAEERVQRRLAAIMAADVAGYSRLMGEDEEGTRARFNEQLEEIIRPSIHEHRGRLVKTMGDGFLVEFGSVVDAVQCAANIQIGVVSRQSGEPDGRKMLLRIGVHLGDVIVENDDIHGDGINIAARLEELSEPGGICVSDMVHTGVRNKLSLTFDDLGEQSLKNIADPLQVFRVVLAPAKNENAVALDAQFRRPAVAVLPFENMSGDPEQDYFADGLTEDIITSLSLWRSFPVIARNSTFAYKGQSPDIRLVGRELGARYIIEGSVRKSGNRIRVTAQLINAETGHHIWAERYDREIGDFFAVQDDIAERIAVIIEPALVRAEGQQIAAKRPTDLGAWEYCLRGFALLSNPTKKDTDLAREMFDRALELDPGYSRAYTGIAYSHIRDYRYGFTDSRDETRQAMLNAAHQAVELDDTDSEAHTYLARAYALVREGESAIAEAQRALELNPHNAEAEVMLGLQLALWGQPEEGIRRLKSGLELNPLEPRNFIFLGHLCLAYICLNQYDAAVLWGKEATRRKTDYFESHVFLAAALSHLARFEEARAVLKPFADSALEYVKHLPHLPDEVKECLLIDLRKAELPE